MRMWGYGKRCIAQKSSVQKKPLYMLAIGSLDANSLLRIRYAVR